MLTHLKAGRDKPLGKWLGRMSNADPHDIPEGGAQIQNNLQCLREGVLSVRGGVQSSSNFTDGSPGTDSLISIYGYVRPEGNGVLCVESDGRLSFRRGGSSTSLQTGLNTYRRWHFEKDRRGRAIITSGMERGLLWDGLEATPVELGIDPPTTTHSVASPTGGAATAGDYVMAYRYVDDRLPPTQYSSLSTLVAHTAATSDKFEHTGLAVSSQSRIKKVEIWRSASEAPNVLYRIGQWKIDGTITTSATNGGNVEFTLPAGHTLTVGARITVSGHSVGDYNQTHEITAVTATTVVTDDTYTSDGTGGTWVFEGYMEDTSSDSTLQEAAKDNSNLRLPVLNANGSIWANRFAPPPNWKAVCKSFQDRFWYGVDVVYSEGTVSASSGSATVTGSGTNFETAMAGRYIYVDGGSKGHLIDSVGSTTSLTLAEETDEAWSADTFAIRSSPTERNAIYFSEVDEPESVPRTNVIDMQENTDDDDEITGLMPFGAVLYILKSRHVYALSFVSQPLIDVSGPRLISERGACNPRCYDFHERKAYLMDNSGAWSMDLSGGEAPISVAIQDIFRDTIDWSKQDWFSVVTDKVHDLVYFFVAFTGDSGTYPTRALVFNIRTSQWWTESYPDGIGDSGKVEISGAITTLLGGSNERVLEVNQDGPDLLATAFSGTATAGGASTLTDSGASFAAIPVGTIVAITGGTGKGQTRAIASHTGTVLTVSSAWTTQPDTTSTYLVGAIEYDFRGGIFAMAPGKTEHERGFELTFEPTTNANNLILRHYVNHETTAKSQDVTHGEDFGGRITRTANSVDIDVPLGTTDDNSNSRPGWAWAGVGGRHEDRMDGERWATPELNGFKGDDAIDIYDLIVKGTG